MNYARADKTSLANRKNELADLYERYKEKKLNLTMMRGVPCVDQLDLSDEMLTIVGPDGCRSTSGIETRNYGNVDGLPEAKKLFADMLGVSDKEVIVGGNSSLNMMYDALSRAMLYGVVGSEKPWGKLDKVRFLCPVPGYDRHFSVCQSLGIEMINVAMTPDGPDMDEVERLVASDASIKGIWCVPKYSNPQGYTYSAKTVTRMANLKPAAGDFRIMWDNAYAVHHLTDTPDQLENILEEAKKAGNADMPFVFASTSKITYPGAGIAAIAASEANIAQIRGVMSMQTIGHDKLNQLRHVKFLPDMASIERHMVKHAAILKPKFDLVDEVLTANLGETGLANWTKPNGGYFVSLDVPEGCAKRTVALAAAIGVALTPAGSTYPYMKDPTDHNIRIAPTFPSLENLRTALEILCVCVELAYLEQTGA